MGTQRTSFAKLQREKAKKEKAEAKREKRMRRAETRDEEDVPEEDGVAGPIRPAAELMDLMEALHRRFDDGNISFDDFEEEKAELLAQLAQSADI